ncbi:MAG: hypothetical protein AAFW66_13220, partial [Pseudomonadota bacterium]
AAKKRVNVKKARIVVKKKNKPAKRKVVKVKRTKIKVAPAPKRNRTLKANRATKKKTRTN